MMTNDRTMIIGTFRDKDEEARAIDDLRDAGFSGDEVEVADHEQDDDADVSVSEALTERGLSDDEAHFYQQQFRAGNNLVAVRAEGRRTQAEDILRRHGGLSDRSARAQPMATTERVGPTNTVTTSTDRPRGVTIRRKVLIVPAPRARERIGKPVGEPERTDKPRTCP